MILTRHLYNKEDVFNVLLYSLLNKKKERMMYWAFELYYSGFGEEVFIYLIKIYEDYYKKFNPLFEDFIKNKFDKWKSKKEYMTIIEKDRLLSIILLNMIYRSYKKKRRERYVLVEIDTHLYYYKSNKEKPKPYLVLRNRCLYDINKYNTIIRTKEDLEEYKNNLYYNWVYYAYFSPIWRERIQKYKGYQNHKLKKIEFLNHMYEEEFYNKYNLEPDEQPKYIQDRIIG